MRRRTIAISVLVLVGVAAAVVWLAVRSTPQSVTAAVSKSRGNIVSRVLQGRPRDYFSVIEDPQYLTVEQAGDLMSDDEVVLGLELGGESRAYSINHLDDHDMVRDEIGGQPILVTW